MNSQKTEFYWTHTSRSYAPKYYALLYIPRIIHFVPLLRWFVLYSYSSIYRYPLGFLHKHVPIMNKKEWLWLDYTDPLITGTIQTNKTNTQQKRVNITCYVRYEIPIWGTLFGIVLPTSPRICYSHLCSPQGASAYGAEINWTVAGNIAVKDWS